jgi:SAM-dependent methyltransferase
VTESDQILQQYKTKDNLQLRIQTHEKYSRPKVDFVAWVLDQIEWHGDEIVVDVGCGAAIYAGPAGQRGKSYFAGDLSIGMLQGLTISGLPRVNLNVQQLPFADESADVVLANHMLYHVPDQDAALRQISRILRPDGFLIAATNSASNMAELSGLRAVIGRQLNIPADSFPLRPTLSFTLENGTQLLGKHFARVTRHDLPSALIFPDAQPVMDYINSSRSYYLNELPEEITWEQIEEMILEEVNGRIVKEGLFRVNKLTGVFICQKD